MGATGANVVLFDHDGDGLKTGTGWVKADDGLLVLDRNANGTIDTGAELFGVDTLLANGQKAANGFAALADLDLNHDGVFNSSDAAYTQVRVWQDANQDGLSQAGELKTLAALGVTGINLAPTTVNQALAGGNVLDLQATYTKAGGHRHRRRLETRRQPLLPAIPRRHRRNPRQSLQPTHQRRHRPYPRCPDPARHARQRRQCATCGKPPAWMAGWPPASRASWPPGCRPGPA
ncbi:MAG: hypothetical protein IPJ99_04605 [Betaproteobacteria bacterium]|nr:hypothetical protein [Betaproteobacteria bacterium]